MSLSNTTWIIKKKSNDFEITINFLHPYPDSPGGVCTITPHKPPGSRSSEGRWSELDGQFVIAGPDNDGPGSYNPLFVGNYSNGSGKGYQTNMDSQAPSPFSMSQS